MSPKKPWLRLLPILTVFALPSANADGEKMFFVEGGFLSQNLNRYATKPDGSTSLNGAVYTDVGLSAQFPLSSEWFLSPLVAYTPFGYKLGNDKQKSKLMPIALRLAYHFADGYVHAGPGLLIQSTSGGGGTVTLNNGISTAEFGLPGESRSSKLVSIHVGGGVKNGELRLGLDAIVTGLLSSDRRAVSLLLNAGFGFY